MKIATVVITFNTYEDNVDVQHFAESLVSSLKSSEGQLIADLSMDKVIDIAADDFDKDNIFLRNVKLMNTKRTNTNKIL